jgi:transposase
MGKSITDCSSITTVGLDLAKHVFQVHGVDASGRVVVAKSDEAQQAAGVFCFAKRVA